jgi:hypothetical protein
MTPAALELHKPAMFRRQDAPPVDLLPEILALLGSANVKREGRGYRVNAIWRGGDSLTVGVKPDPTAPGGCVYYDRREREGGNGVQLAKLLGLNAGTGRVDHWERQRQLDAAAQRNAELAAKRDREAIAHAAEARAFFASCHDPYAVNLERWAYSRGLTTETLRRAGTRATPVQVGGYGLILPVYDAAGELVSYRRRWTDLVTPNDAKEIDARGASAHPNGRVYATHSGVQLLTGDPAAIARAERWGIVIAEGGPDWLTALHCYADLRNEAPIVLGVWSGSFGGPALWQRLPEAAPVCIATDNDAAGDRYAATVRPMLRSRCVSRRGPGPDLNHILTHTDDDAAAAVRHVIKGLP